MDGDATMAVFVVTGGMMLILGLASAAFVPDAKVAWLSAAIFIMVGGGLLAIGVF